MTAAKRHLKNSATFISRRTHHGEFLLHNDRSNEVKRITFYSLVLHAKKAKQSIIAFVAMTNHFHTVLFDEHALRSAFTQNFNSCMSRAINKYRNRCGHFWSNQKVSDPTLLDIEAVIQKVVYTALNPVRAGLVEKASDWPLSILPKHWGKTMKVKRPDTYFRETNAHPDVIELIPMPPPGFEAWTLRQTIKFFNKLIRRGERQLAKERLAAGKTVKGIDAIYDENPRRKIRTTSAANCRPQFFGTDAETYKRAKIALRKFRSDLLSAVRQFKEGRKASFPAGTIQMRRRFGVTCCEVEFDDPLQPSYYAPSILAA